MDRIHIMWFVTVGLLLTSWRPYVFAAPNCARVVAMLPPCWGFITGQDPSEFCCSSIKNLEDMGKTKEDRVAMCNCVKQVSRIVSYDPKRITVLPKKCGLDSTFPPIDQEYDCKEYVSFFPHNHSSFIVKFYDWLDKDFTTLYYYVFENY
ncbi:non-specific lipid-transfer protein [Artemisia annua]|uniref:Non-specific lipid-transfer protein n=1 Tax=Artemisia annua TaxID=35608 RepID=A0A2U1L999_ARTAN|nr:non-specific lipid-transfer protein [Artemisia annua]